MNTKAICLIALALLAGLTLATPDSLRSQMMDWMDVEGQSIVYGPRGSVYSYQGTRFWDLAMGDSFLVWLPGTDIYYFVNPLNQTEVETLAGFDFGPIEAQGVAVDDSIWYIVGGGGVLGYVYDVDSMRLKDGVGSVGANFFYAEIEDTFLYTTSWGDLYCINIADPETLFVARTLDDCSGCDGIAPMDGDIYTCCGYTLDVHDDYSTFRTIATITKADMVNSAEPSIDSIAEFPNYEGGDIGYSDSLLFYVDTYLSDWDVETETGYNLGSTRLGVLGYDYTYTWSEPDDELSFGVDVLNEYILAVGFEHGFSVLNYSNLDSIYEVAYYRDTDSIFAFTHFALKETRLFAVAHPRTDICRLWMFELDDSVISGIEENPPSAKPSAISISAWPNPFNSSVTITIDIPVGDGSPVPISVEIYDVNGRRVSVIGNYDQTVIARRASPDEAISYECEKDCFGQSPRNDNADKVIWRPDESLPSGVYLVRASVGEEIATRRVVYLK